MSAVGAIVSRVVHTAHMLLACPALVVPCRCTIITHGNEPCARLYAYPCPWRAQSFRLQSQRCPICRQPVELLVQVQPELLAAHGAGDGDGGGGGAGGRGEEVEEDDEEDRLELRISKV